MIGSEEKFKEREIEKYAVFYECVFSNAIQTYKYLPSLKF